MTNRHIIDNCTRKVADCLKPALRDAAAFSVVSAYFTIYGYALLEAELNSVAKVRFLFGDPSSVKDLDPGEDEPKSFQFTEHGLEPRFTLEQKGLARQCAEWVGKSNVSIRSARRSHFLHGKMYLTESAHDELGIVGSSNFTQKGLGGSDKPNLEINLATHDTTAVMELLDWFNQLWHDDHFTKDVKEEVLNALNRIGGDQSPEKVYYKTLYELFYQSMKARLAGEDLSTTTGFQDSKIWNTLYGFQRDGAESVIAKLKEHNGCILADSVGLGKTYTALAVIKHFELRENARVLVLCPKKLLDNWSLYPAAKNHKQNPFLEDRFAYTLLAHTDLSRDSGTSGGIDLATFNWQNYNLVVIDESHNFRNQDGQRYKKLLEEVIKAGSKTKILMLSATPVNTSLIDLRNQIYLMTEGREAAFSQSLNVPNIHSTMREAQQAFKEWEDSQSKRGHRNKAALSEQLGGDFLRLLNGVSIARSRRQIEEFYAEEIGRIGQFPERAKPTNKYPPTDLDNQLSYQDLTHSINQFKLSIYQPSAYVVDAQRKAELESRRKAQNFNQRDSERFLVGMMRVNCLKRLESSPHSLKLTLERTIDKIDNILERINAYNQNKQSVGDTLPSNAVLPNNDEEDEEFLVNRSRNPYHLRELDLPLWQAHLESDRNTLAKVLSQMEAITPERDGKLQQLKQAIRNKVEHPTRDREGRPNRKLLVFTAFKDTALYLYDNLKTLVPELYIEMAMVSGDETHATAGVNKFHHILTNFAPTARQRPKDSAPIDLDLLIATDCISEGQNLQDCDTVLNYDIHWNPVRLIQRFGRIDRIGSRNHTVHMVNYWPTSDMEVYLKLQGRVQARMALADLAATGDDDPFTEADAQQELRFRDDQLLQLKEQTLDLDDLNDTPSMGDFTLDYFFTQLLRYLETNKDALEAMPRGVYALAKANTNTEPGVIFFLRQNNASDAKPQQHFASPVHPFYFVYVQENGKIRYGCRNARQILAIFQAAAAGQDALITQLCDRFDQDTNQGRTMDHYNKLLNATLTHIRYSHRTTQMQGLSSRRDFLLPKASEAPHNAADFELVTWLVIKEAP